MESRNVNHHIGFRKGAVMECFSFAIKINGK